MTISIPLRMTRNHCHMLCAPHRCIKSTSDFLQSDATRDDPANPSILKKQMDVLTDQFAGYEQRDAHEFIADIIDFLHDELTSAQEEKGEQLELELLTDKYFCLDVDVCLTCKLQILEVQSRIISPLVSRSWNTSRRSRGGDDT